MVSAYPNLVSEIAKRGYRKTVIARCAGMNSRTLYNKLAGKSDFTYPQAVAIQREFFPDIDTATLFARVEQDENTA